MTRMRWPQKFEILLRSGRPIQLQVLKQSETYAELIHGTPDTQMNAGIIQSALNKAVLPHTLPGAPHLISPVESPLESRSKSELHKKSPDQFGAPAQIPGIVCEGRFSSFAPARDVERDGSWLILVWFQHNWALPIADDVLQQIQALDWDSLAHDIDEL